MRRHRLSQTTGTPAPYYDRQLISEHAAGVAWRLRLQPECLCGVPCLPAVGLPWVLYVPNKPESLKRKYQHVRNVEIVPVATTVVGAALAIVMSTMKAFSTVDDTKPPEVAGMTNTFLVSDFYMAERIDSPHGVVR